jgi:hypothetical protein
MRAVLALVVILALLVLLRLFGTYHDTLVLDAVWG